MVTLDLAIEVPEMTDNAAKAYSNYIIRKVVQRCRKCSAHQLQSCAIILYGNEHTTFQIQLQRFFANNANGNVLVIVGIVCKQFAHNNTNTICECNHTTVRLLNAQFFNASKQRCTHAKYKA